MTNRFSFQIFLIAALCVCLGLPLSAQDASTPKSGTKAKPKPAVNKGSAPAPSTRTKGKLKPVALNSATKNEIGFMLKIDSALAAKIVAGRPYHTKAELVTKGIISMEQYKTLKDKVAVH